MKSLICTFVLLCSLSLMAQDTSQPKQTENKPNVSSQEPPVPIPDAKNPNLDDPAVTTTVTVDSVTLPENVGIVPHKELAHSISQQPSD